MEIFCILTERIELDPNVTWREFEEKLKLVIATPVDLMRLYKSTDEEREDDFHELITPENRDNKLIDLAGLQPDGYYEFDLELPCAAHEATKIQVQEKECSIIADGDIVLDLKPGSRKPRLPTTGWVRNYDFFSMADFVLNPLTTI